MVRRLTLGEARDSSATIDREEWASFGKTRPLTINDLRRYSAVNLDPYTAEISQVLCERFKLSPLGHRNLATPLLNLFGTPSNGGVFQIGYSDRHVINTTLKSDSGFVLVAIIGLLAEYFHEDFVVDFFVCLARKAKLSENDTPSRQEWRTMVDTYCGVLACSSFGLLLSEMENRCPADLGPPDAQTVLDAMDEMSELVMLKKRDVREQITISANGELVWLAAVAGWVFDLGVAMKASGKLEPVSVLPGLGDASDASIVFACRSPLVRLPASALTLGAIPPISTPAYRINGGRVRFNDSLRSCFGDGFIKLNKITMAACLSCASVMIHDALRSEDRQATGFDLARATGVLHNKPGGLLEVIMAWFPELRRYSSQFETSLKAVQADPLAHLRRIIFELKQQCLCVACIGNPRCASARPAEVCNLSLIEFIVRAGLSVPRMTITQNLYPKRKGILAAYKQVHATRLKRIASNRASSLSSTETQFGADSVTTDFVTAVTDVFPTLSQILELGLLLFSGTRLHSSSSQLVPQLTSPVPQHQSSLFTARPVTVSVTSSGLSIYLNSQRELHSAIDKNCKELLLGVTIVPGWLCVYGHEAKLILWDDGPGNRAFEPTYQKMRGSSADFRQCIQWADRIASTGNLSGARGTLLSSMVKKGIGEEEKAEEEGWWVLT